MVQNQKRNKCNSRKNYRKRRKTTNNSWFSDKRRIILEDKMSACNKMININTRQNEQRCKEKRNTIFRQKKIVLFKSKLEK